MNLAWSHSRRQIKGKYSDGYPYIFFTFVTRVYFLFRIVQKWRLKMAPLCYLLRACPQYLTHKNNTNGVRVEY